MKKVTLLLCLGLLFTPTRKLQAYDNDNIRKVIGCLVFVGVLWGISKLLKTSADEKKSPEPENEQKQGLVIAPQNVEKDNDAVNLLSNQPVVEINQNAPVNKENKEEVVDQSSFPVKEKNDFLYHIDKYLKQFRKIFHI